MYMAWTIMRKRCGLQGFMMWVYVVGIQCGYTAWTMRIRCGLQAYTLWIYEYYVPRRNEVVVFSVTPPPQKWEVNPEEFLEITCQPRSQRHNNILFLL